MSCVYGHDVVNKACIKCPENCLKCNSINTCTTCAEGFKLGNGQCSECKLGYFRSSPSKCSKCIENCDYC